MIAFWGCELAASHLLLVGALVGVFTVYLVQLAQKLMVWFFEPHGPEWTEKDEYLHSLVIRRIDEVNEARGAAQATEKETFTSVVEKAPDGEHPEKNPDFNVNISEGD